MVIGKDEFDSFQKLRLERFRGAVRTVCPPLKEVAGSITDWNNVKLLQRFAHHQLFGRSQKPGQPFSPP